MLNHVYFRFLALCAKKRPEFEVLNFFMANPIDINVTDIDGNFGLLMATVCGFFYLETHNNIQFLLGKKST